ncbi:hypothetical protein SO802_001645 [Lithocarpus litseifolius]|uniref:Uncharacterized protein n=1 Tax=Lithocarpus litseifolius TaxID=425828 RepID=A0AAW2DW01_9ROSI
MWLSHSNTATTVFEMPRDPMDLEPAGSSSDSEDDADDDDDDDNKRDSSWKSARDRKETCTRRATTILWQCHM